MENATMEKNEFQHSNTPKKLSSSQSPLLDLPVPITEQILERLPLPDYIRFGSVCTKWHSIQKQHRIYHSPLPPPMQKSFPWLIPRTREEKKIKLLPCYSPLEQKSFSLSIPKGRYNIIFSASASSHGWVFLVDIDHRKQISLYNPVSKSQIKLPPLMTSLSIGVIGVLSASPLSLDCVALILDEDILASAKAFLYRLDRRQSKWMLLDIPYELDVVYDRHSDCVYCNGKFYCIGEDFFVIDLVSTTPIVNELVMDCSQLPSADAEYDQEQTLIESNGEVLLVASIYNQSCTLVGSLDVFKADFSRMMWVRLKSIGDRALFAGTNGSFSVQADDVGCKSNCVYFIKYAKPHYLEWSVFDMDTMKWLNGPPRYKEGKWYGYVEQWFLPSLIVPFESC